MSLFLLHTPLTSLSHGGGVQTVGRSLLPVYSLLILEKCLGVNLILKADFLIFFFFGLKGEDYGTCQERASSFPRATNVSSIWFYILHLTRTSF